MATRWGLSDDETFRLLMVVNELVTNAVEHARTPYRVTVRLSGSILRVLVTDHSDAAPQLQLSTLDKVRGHGLLLVDSLASQWGWSHHDNTGKTVWASIAHEQS